MPDSATPDPVASALHRAGAALARLQQDDGSWEGEVVWCPIITAQIAILHVIAGNSISAEERRLLLRHFSVTRRPDGGWGLHPESHSYRFVTTLVYVALRLLGEGRDAAMPAAARRWLEAQPGGVESLPQWGKIWLSFLGLYDPSGLNPCPPELFLLPDWIPFAPWRLYCHTRYIYLGMAFLLGSGFRADLGPIAAELRQELYGAGDTAARHRHEIAPSDVHVRPGRGLRLAYDAARALGALWRRLPFASGLRRRALDACFARILYEQRATRHQALSPVNGVLNTLALFARDPASADTSASLAGLESWRWSDEAWGIRYAGARSTTWDTSSAIQALLEQGGGAVREHADTLRRGYRRLAAMQMTTELEHGHAEHRDPILGGWCFSDGTHRWPVSDCTAEALSAILGCHAVAGLIAPEERIGDERLREAAAFILNRQNRDGGFGTYERRRGGRLLERLNPSEMFGQCMTELSYIECTASAVRALCRFAATGLAPDPDHLQAALARAVAFILARQLPSGAWPGFWGINFVYGTGFAVAALRAAGLDGAHSAMRRAAACLRSVQRADGGWGEHFSGCLSGTYVENETSLVITTSWAVLALIEAEARPSDAAWRGVEWLRARQDRDGCWPHEGVNGVFFGTAMLDYRLYNAYFPNWALARFEACRHASAH